MQRLFAALAAALATAQEVRKETVVVTGSYEPVAIEEADRAVRRVEVRADSALANSVTDALNRDASVDLRQRGQSNIQTDLSIRGSTFGQTLVLLNGMRLNDVQSGHHNLDLPVALEAIESVEILKGAGSTLYGSDAIGGVVHFVTRPPEASEVRLRAGYGSFGTNQQRASAAYVKGPLSQQLAVYRDFSSGFVPNRDFRNLALSSTTNVRTRLGTTEVIAGHADKPFGAEQFYGNFNSWERTKTWFASARQTFGERTSAAAAYRRHTDLFVLFRDRPQVFTNRHAAESAQANFRRWEPLGGTAKLHWGFEGLREDIESNNLGRHTRARGSAYAAVEARALRRFSLSAGAREEFYSAGQRQFIPSVAAGAWVNTSIKLRASVSRAFRLPTFTDLYYHDPANLGSPDLRPERAWSYEGGFDWHASRRAHGEVTLFHRRETDGIDYVRRSPADIWRATNFQRLRFTGIETSARFALPRNQNFDLSYTGLRGVRQAVAGVFSRYAFNYPTHYGVAGWHGTVGPVAVRTRIGAVQRYARATYGVFDLYTARSSGALRPFVHLTNLTDTAYQEIFGVAMPGRAALAGVEWVWTRR